MEHRRGSPCACVTLHHLLYPKRPALHEQLVLAIATSMLIFIICKNLGRQQNKASIENMNYKKLNEVPAINYGEVENEIVIVVAGASMNARSKRAKSRWWKLCLEFGFTHENGYDTGTGTCQQ